MADAARSRPMLHPNRAAVVDHIRAMRRPSESYRDVILKLVELKTSDLK